MTLSSLDYLDLPMSLIISLMLVTKLQKSIGELTHFKKCNIVNSFYASICKELKVSKTALILLWPILKKKEVLKILAFTKGQQKNKRKIAVNFFFTF